MDTGPLTKMRNRGGVNPPSREEVHIYRLPPSAKFTRKKERISEADVLWAFRPDGEASDPTRINEGIRYYARGVNPSVEVDYQNHGSAGSRTSSLHQAQVGSAYKLDVVRPPLFPVETLHSLSNPRTHQTISVETIPGLSAGMATDSLAEYVDKEVISQAITASAAAGPRTLQATRYYKLQVPEVMSAKFAINENKRESYEMMTNPHAPISTDTFTCREETPYGTIIRPTYSVTSNPAMGRNDAVLNTDASDKVKKEVLLQSIRPNFNVIIYDPSNHVSSEVSANVRQKNYIAVQAALGRPITLDRQDGTHIKLRDYNWTAVQTNAGVDQVILTIENPDIQLERNLPLYATSTGLTMPTDVMERKNQDYDLEGKLEVYAQPNVDLSTWYAGENTRTLQAERSYVKPTQHFSFDNQGSARPMQFARELPRTRDTSRFRHAAGQAYNRTFE
jgi:hypothetical protein